MAIAAQEQFHDFMSFVYLNKQFDEGTVLIKKLKEADDADTETLDAFDGGAVEAPPDAAE